MAFWIFSNENKSIVESDSHNPTCDAVNVCCQQIDSSHQSRSIVNSFMKTLISNSSILLWYRIIRTQSSFLYDGHSSIWIYFAIRQLYAVERNQRAYHVFLLATYHQQLQMILVWSKHMNVSELMDYDVIKYGALMSCWIWKWRQQSANK